jgi:lipoyl(octanoyl) transferase
MGVIEFVRALEEALIRTCADFAIATKRIPGLTGVWTGAARNTSAGSGSSGGKLDGRGRPAPHGVQDISAEAKIAALGIHISRGVTSHGIALNVNTDLTFFNLIVPCGITSKPVTSMANQLGREVAMQEIAVSFEQNCGALFGQQMLRVESLDSISHLCV